jgi:phage terminase large subunit-like protein
VSAVESPIERVAALPARQRERWWRDRAAEEGLTVDALKARLLTTWRFTARPKQLAPAGDWMWWFVNAGRGFGKTLTGAQWTRRVAGERRCRVALVGPTLGDVRRTMIEGETGMLSVLPMRALRGGSRSTAYNRTTLEVFMSNGSILQGFSSEEPDRLRGPQHHYAWCEEVSSWQDADQGLDELDTTFSNLKLGLRLGLHPRAVLTSTPKANKLTRELVGLARSGSLALVRGSSYENRANLSEVWWNEVVAPLEGKRLGRQEIMAEILDDVEGALWSRAQIDRLRVDPADLPPLRRIVVAVDPNVSSKQGADSAGILVVAIERTRHRPRCFVLADRTVEGGGPRAWSVAVVRAYQEFEADRVVAEVNNGGELVEMVLKNLDRSIPYKAVRASVGKRTRAEPVSALYEGEPGDPFPPSVFHAAAPAELADLEDEMTTWVPGEQSPNRMDALVWAITDLAITRPPGYGRSSVPKGRIPGVPEPDEGIEFYA